MNFILIENVEGKENIMWENNPGDLPGDSIAFTYYQQDKTDENGMVSSCEYRIGKPIKFVLGDMYIELENDVLDSQDDGVYCLYIHDERKLSQPIKRIVKPVKSNTTLVSDFSELRESFSILLRKEQTRKK